MNIDIIFDGHGHTIVYVVLTALLSVITFIIGRHFPAKINSKIVKNNINSKVINHGVAELQQNSARKPKRKQSRARKRKFKRMKLDYSHCFCPVLNSDVKAVLPCIRKRRSVFPKNYSQRDVLPQTMQSLLDAALWAPYHGRSSTKSPPGRFVVLGKKSMVAMQQLTLKFYDKNWQTTGWGSGVTGTQEQYDKWREMTEGEITGRWGPVSYMVAIVMQRQTGPKRFPEWEEAAATACAVQNMHLQATAFPGLACYWSSWHEAARDSEEMKQFLKMGPEDKCFGFFIVACCSPDLKDRRVRRREELNVEWRDDNPLEPLK